MMIMMKTQIKSIFENNMSSKTMHSTKENYEAEEYAEKNLQAICDDS